MKEYQLKRIFSNWFHSVSPEYPDINLGGIRKILQRAFTEGFDLAYGRGYRQGYDDRDKEEPPVEEVKADIPYEPTPKMIDAGARRLVDWDALPTAQEKEQARVLAERTWRAMWNEH
jgi:hypothetical protein